MNRWASRYLGLRVGLIGVTIIYSYNGPGRKIPKCGLAFINIFSYIRYIIVYIYIYRYEYIMRMKCICYILYQMKSYKIKN